MERVWAAEGLAGQARLSCQHQKNTKSKVTGKSLDDLGGISNRKSTNCRALPRRFSCASLSFWGCDRR